MQFQKNKYLFPSSKCHPVPGFKMLSLAAESRALTEVSHNGFLAAILEVVLLPSQY